MNRVNIVILCVIISLILSIISIIMSAGSNKGSIGPTGPTGPDGPDGKCDPSSCKSSSSGNPIIDLKTFIYTANSDSQSLSIPIAHSTPSNTLSNTPLDKNLKYTAIVNINANIQLPKTGKPGTFRLITEKVSQTSQKNMGTLINASGISNLVIPNISPDSTGSITLYLINVISKSYSNISPINVTIVGSWSIQEQ